MPPHLFSVGDRVSLAATMRAADLGQDIFTVKARMPHVGTRLQYRVKTDGEPYERVVTEEQLTPLAVEQEPAV